MNQNQKGKVAEYNPFETQYYSIYQKRFNDLKQDILTKISPKIEGTEFQLTNSTEVQIEHGCTIIGCINKTYKNETSFIEVIEDP